MTEDMSDGVDRVEADGVADPDTPGNGDRANAKSGSHNGSTPDGHIDLTEAQSLGREHAEEVLSYPVDNVIKVTADGEDWRVVVEVVERSSVPDTQDILARYELRLDATGALTGYNLVDRYRRGDLRGDF